MRKALCLLAMLLAATSFSTFARAAETVGRVSFQIVDQTTGETVPCRIHLKNSAGQTQTAAGPPGIHGMGDPPFLYDHFTCPGAIELKLLPDTYTYEIGKGKEYLSQSGSFTVVAGEKAEVKIELERLADMAAEGWFAADLHNHRKPQDMKLLMQAEGINIGSALWWFDSIRHWAGHGLIFQANLSPPSQHFVKFDDNYYCYLMAGEDERGTGVVIYFNLPRILPPDDATWHYPPAVQLVEDASHDPGAWIDAERSYWWEMPLWLACGRIDSIEIINNSIQRGHSADTEAWGKPRDRDRYPPPRGNANWSQDVYFHILNTGFRIPPSAGTASGVHRSPFGYNRVYVHAGNSWTYDEWWQAFKAGRCFVTNGPLLRVRAQGQFPGHVFTAAEGTELTLELDVALTSRDRVPRIEIIKNGRVERTVDVGESLWNGSLGTVSFKESGWFTVRAVTDVPHTYRFAMTGPYYVEIGDQKHRVSKTSTQFFLDWVGEHAERVRNDANLSPSQKETYLQYHSRAEAFWQKIVNQANAP